MIQTQKFLNGVFTVVKSDNSTNIEGPAAVAGALQSRVFQVISLPVIILDKTRLVLTNCGSWNYAITLHENDTTFTVYLPRIIFLLTTQHRVHSAINSEHLPKSCMSREKMYKDVILPQPGCSILMWFKRSGVSLRQSKHRVTLPSYSYVSESCNCKKNQPQLVPY